MSFDARKKKTAKIPDRVSAKAQLEKAKKTEEQPV